jgi:hypothetical protein
MSPVSGRCWRRGWTFTARSCWGKCSGLTVDRLRQRAALPSSLSLLGLIRPHCRGGLRLVLPPHRGRERRLAVLRRGRPDGEFDDLGTADAGQDYATYRREIGLARQAAAGRGLEETFFHVHRHAQRSVRRVYVHTIEEYARHIGHADLLGERIDGATGL